jgi:hypothetical protein
MTYRDTCISCDTVRPVNSETGLCRDCEAAASHSHVPASEIAEVQAKIDANGGVWEFTALKERHRVVDAHGVHGRYGRVWKLADHEAEHFGRRFVPCGDRSKIQKRLGLHEGKVTRPAVAVVRQGRLPGSYYVTIGVREDAE